MQTVKVSQGGRVVIPADLREKLRINQGDELILEERNGELVFTAKLQRIRQIRQEILAGMPDLGKRSLAEELISERKAEIDRE
jgi:AbrB family looped-hinge helix DNA binding protein